MFVSLYQTCENQCKMTAFPILSYGLLILRAADGTSICKMSFSSHPQIVLNI